VKTTIAGVKLAAPDGREGSMADGAHEENPLADDFAPVSSCAICGKPIEKASGDVIVTALQNAVHAQCAARLAA
jgi:hypothetical protein